MYEHNCVFRCNPKLNRKCKKAGCQKECFYTTHKEYSVDGKFYRYNEFFSNYEEVEIIPWQKEECLQKP